MIHVRELVGALTQARVQMIAAQTILDNEMAQDAVEGGEVGELKVVELNSQKLTRCLNIVGDVRDWAEGKLREPQQDPSDDTPQPDAP